MPLASDQGPINANIIAAPGVQPVTPAINDLIDAYRKGVVTAQDFIDRNIQIPVNAAKAKQEIADQNIIRPLARQAQVGALQGEIEIQPNKQKLLQGQVEQGIAALPTTEEQQASSAERLKSAQTRNALASSDSKVRLNAIATLSTDDTLNLWTAATGQPPPDHLEIPNAEPVTPKPIDEFYLEHFGEHPAGTIPRDNLNKPEVQAAYQKYVQESQNRPESVFKGDPRYIQILKKDLEDKNLKVAIQGAQIKAIPGVLEKKAAAEIEAPAKAQETAKQEQKTYGTRQEIQDLRSVQGAYYKMKNLLSPENTASPATDMGIIFSWMKILDPRSTVREGEYATAENARSIPDTVRTWYNRTVSGQKLTETQRKDFAAALEPVYAGQVQAAAATINQYLDTEEELGLPGKIVPPADAAAVRKYSTKGPEGEINPVKPAISGTPSGGTNQQPQVGDNITLKDGRKVTVKEIRNGRIFF
jgi:hypothetical protein